MKTKFFVIVFVSTLVLGSLTGFLINAYAATSSVGNSNSGTVAQSSNDNSATGGEGGSAEVILGDEYYLSAPSTVAESGQRASAMYSFFGGVNMAQTEEAKQTSDNIKLLVFMAKNEIINRDELRKEAIAQYKQLRHASKPKRVLGILWRTRGNHVGNLFGALAMDSLLPSWGEPNGEL